MQSDGCDLQYVNGTPSVIPQSYIPGAPLPTCLPSASDVGASFNTSLFSRSGNCHVEGYAEPTPPLALEAGRRMSAEAENEEDTEESRHRQSANNNILSNQQDTVLADEQLRLHPVLSQFASEAQKDSVAALLRDQQTHGFTCLTSPRTLQALVSASVVRAPLSFESVYAQQLRRPVPLALTWNPEVPLSVTSHSDRKRKLPDDIITANECGKTSMYESLSAQADACSAESCDWSRAPSALTLGNDACPESMVGPADDTTFQPRRKQIRLECPNLHQLAGDHSPYQGKHFINPGEPAAQDNSVVGIGTSDKQPEPALLPTSADETSAFISRKRDRGEGEWVYSSQTRWRR